ncbi:hypothetical protein AUP68_05154 [Ilyonectria robusta]
MDHLPAVLRNPPTPRPPTESHTAHTKQTPLSPDAIWGGGRIRVINESRNHTVKDSFSRFAPSHRGALHPNLGRSSETHVDATGQNSLSASGQPPH